MSDPTTDGPAAPPPPRASRPGRGLRIALAVSVALNLAVAGMLGGAALKFGHTPPVALRDLGFGPFTEALTREQRGELRQTFLRHAPDFRQARRLMREDAVALLASLRAEPFDPEVFSGLLMQTNRRNADRLAQGEAALRDFILRMEPAERLAFADRLQAALTGDGKRPQRDAAPKQTGP